MWRQDIAHRGDVAHVLKQCLAETGDVTLFLSAPPEIQEELLETLRNFKKSGVSEICISHTALHKDVSAEALAAIEVLIKASVLDPDAAAISPKRPFFIGTKHLRNGEELAISIPVDPGLVAAKLVGIGTPYSSPMGAPRSAKISVQFEFYEREAKSDNFFELNPTRSCVAHLEVQGLVSHVFTELASDYIASISIEPAKLGRRLGFNIALDFHVSQGALFCESISLCSLEWLEVERYG